MGHPHIDNRTPFAFANVYLQNEEARPVLVTIVRATYEIAGRALRVAEIQAPVPVAGELYGDSPETSSYRYEPEAAYIKPATDLVLIGHAYSPRVGAHETQVTFQVGSLSKTVNVWGDRVWTKWAAGVGPTRPEPFEKIPLVYERAFGGWDKSASTPQAAAVDNRNPVGTGFRTARSPFEEGVRLPNLEDPSDPLERYGQIVPVAGFGFTSSNWEPRASLAGTYDEAWMKERMPLFPKNFDRRFYNAGAHGLVAPSLHGDEVVHVRGASPVGMVSFKLPAPPRPVCLVSLLRRPDTVIETHLDTVIVNTDEDKVYMTWRGHVPLKNGPHDVRHILIETPGLTRHTAR